MHATFPLGRPAGIRVGAHWSVFPVMALPAQVLAQVLLPAAVPGLSPVVSWATGVTGSVVFLTSLLVHELGHAIAAQHRGLDVDGITLWLLGGSTELPEEPPDPRTAFAVAVAGPVASLLAGAGFLGVSLPASGVTGVTLAWLGWANLVLAAVNLLPGTPLDGGRVLQAVVGTLTGDRRRARTAAARTGRVLGLVVAGIGLGQLLWSGGFAGWWLLGIGWFLASGAGAEPARERLGRVRLGEIMTPDPVTAPGWDTVEGFAEQAAAGRFRAYPVVASDGRPLGVVSRAALARVPGHARTATRVADICARPPACLVAPPQTPLAAVLDAIGGQDLVLVVSDGVLVGVVSSADVAELVA
ncbi:site-2 protease family protein [Amycolatopsis sp. NEAU-NG30]|uniref:Zinc metalloprotease n=1 Tax=Amycolatopsis melonis TaxID=3156488 RepID=A0ABV0L9F0_9PSEU